MEKRISAMAIAAMLVLSLTACGSASSMAKRDYTTYGGGTNPGTYSNYSQSYNNMDSGKRDLERFSNSVANSNSRANGYTNKAANTARSYSNSNVTGSNNATTGSASTNKGTTAANNVGTTNTQYNNTTGLMK